MVQSKERERVSNQLTSRLTNQEQLTEQIVSQQDMMQGSVIAKKRELVLLSQKGTKFERIINVANTLLARDYKGFGNQNMNGVIEWNEKNNK